MGRFIDGLKHTWNSFTPETERLPALASGNYAGSYSSRPHQVRIRVSNERSIISSIYTRLAIDVASAEIKHVKTDGDGKYIQDMTSGLNNCLTVEANIDQGPRQFLQDLALTVYDKGVAAIVPVDTTTNPMTPGSWDINTWRIGEVVAWYPRYVTVRVYNDQPDKGIKEEITLEKRFVGLIENPFYSVMNEPNSTLQRLIRKLNLLDVVDEQSASGKLDMIIQLPYTIKTEARRQAADQRRKDIEFQLKGSQYGIAYADAAEKITQLNRPAENNLMDQIEYLTTLLYSQLGLTNEILNGTADEKTMLNYYTRTIKPFLDAAQEEIIRKFITKTGRSQGQTILYFKNPFELMPLTDLANVADVLSRNEIVSPNELRMSIGMKPSSDPAADKLQNSNMPAGTTPGNSSATSSDATGGSSDTNAALDQVDSAIDKAFSDFDLNDTEDEEPDEAAS